MGTIDNYEFGHVYKEKIETKDAEKFATIFGEGSPGLTELIKYCILNNIITLASCKGHPEDVNFLERVVEDGYITFQFDMDYEKDDMAYFLASLPLVKKGLTAHMEHNIKTDRTITLYVPAKSKNMSEEYFLYILESLRKYKEIKEQEQIVHINPEVKKIIDYIFEEQKPTEIFEITHAEFKKYERKGFLMKKIAKCPYHDSTSILHEKFGKSLKRTQKLDNFINSSSSKLK